MLEVSANIGEVTKNAWGLGPQQGTQLMDSKIIRDSMENSPALKYGQIGQLMFAPITQMHTKTLEYFLEAHMSTLVLC